MAGGAGVLTFLHHGPPLLGVWLPAGMLAGGFGALLVQAARTFRHRRRPKVDAGMKTAVGGLVLFALGMVLGPVVLLTDMAPGTTTAYGTALILGLGLFVAGHYYKIVPFLVWYHRFGPLAGKKPVPAVGDLYSAGTAHLAGAALFVGSLGLVAAPPSGSVGLARVAAILFLAGAAVLAVQILQIARRRP